MNLQTVFFFGTGRQTHILSMSRYNLLSLYMQSMCRGVCVYIYIYINRKENIAVAVVSVVFQ